MPPPIVTNLVISREPFDCAIVALAMYLGKSYEDVLRAASMVDRKYKGKYGLYEPEIRATAKALGVELKRKKNVNLDEDYGILSMPEHVAVLRNGLLIDNNGTIWDAEEYKIHQQTLSSKFKFLGIFYQE